MATVIESFLVALGFDADTSGANKFTGAMDGIVGKVAVVAAMLGGVLGAGSLAEASDEVTLMSDRLKDLTGSAEAAADMQDKIYESAQRMGASQMDMSQAAARALPALKDMGKGVDEAIKMSEVLMVTARLNGSSVQEASASAQQFSQALGSGTLAGDELKSILENNSTLARTLAEEMGVTVGALKDLGADGKISSQVMADAVLKAYDKVMARSKDLTDTFGMMRIRFRNWYQYAIDRMNKAGVFQPFINGLRRVYDELEKLKDSGQVEKFAKDLADWIDYGADRINSIRKAVKKWADDLGITQYAVTGLKIAVGYLATALAGLQVLMVLRGVASAVMLLLNPFVLIGAAIGAVLLAIDDFMAYGEGRPSVIGDLIKQYPQLQTVIDAISSIGPILGTIWDYAKSLWKQVSDVFMLFSGGEDTAESFGNTTGFAFEEVIKLVKNLSPLFKGLLHVLSMVLRGWVLLIAAFAGGVTRFNALMLSIVSYITGSIASAVNSWIGAIRGFIDTIASMMPNWMLKLLGGGTVDMNVLAPQYSGPITSMADRYTGRKDPLAGGATINSNQTSIFHVGSSDEAVRINRAIEQNAAKNAVRSARSGVKQ